MIDKKSIPLYTFHERKYGYNLKTDVVELQQIRPYVLRDPYHILTYYDITFITEGSGEFYVNGEMHEVSAGDVMFSTPGEIRYWDCKRITQGYALIFKEEELTNHFRDTYFVRDLGFFSPYRLSSKITLPPELWEKVISLVKEIRNEIISMVDMDVLRALLYQTLILLKREYRKVDFPPASEKYRYRSRNLFHRFTNHINELGLREGSVHFYADKLHITPDNLNNVIKRMSGMSAKKYIQKWRISEAKKLLRYTDCSVAEVAERMNFEDPSYFIRFFRSNTGITPLKYQLEERDEF